jgi:hypothetical protein
VTVPRVRRCGSFPGMASTRGFPFTFSAEARILLGPAVTLNAAVREAFPALASGWADHSTVVFEDSDRGPGVGLRPGSRVPAGSVLGLFAGTIRVGSPPRGFAVLPLPAFPFGDHGVRFFVDAELRASHHRTSGDAVLYMHACVDPTVVGEWWLGGPVPCLLARAARDLAYPDELRWDFNEHGGPAFSAEFHDIRGRNLAGLRVLRCTCAFLSPCPRDRFLCAPDDQDSSDGEGWWSSVR